MVGTAYADTLPQASNTLHKTACNGNIHARLRVLTAEAMRVKTTSKMFS